MIELLKLSLTITLAFNRALDFAISKSFGLGGLAGPLPFRLDASAMQHSAVRVREQIAWAVYRGVEAGCRTAHLDCLSLCRPFHQKLKLALACSSCQRCGGLAK